MPYTIELKLGDWSHDGHGITESIYISSNISASKLRKAYKFGVKIAGFNFSEIVAQGYEDNKIKKNHAEKLFSLGFDRKSLDYDKTDDVYYVSADSFVDIWLFICKLGDPNFEFKIKEQKTINIGGYGLFQ